MLNNKKTINKINIFHCFLNLPLSQNTVVLSLQKKLYSNTLSLRKKMGS